MLGYEDVIFKNTLFSADSAEGNKLFTVTVKDADGKAVKNAVLFVYDGDSLITRQRTDESGKASFDLEGTTFTLRIEDVSSDLLVEESYTIVLGQNNITLALTTTEAKIEWSPENLGEAAGYMGVGMLGVFLIVGIIMGATYAINAIINKIANRKKDAE